jgi:membrane protein
MLFVIRYFSRKTRAHHVDAYAAQAAFFLLVSTVPLLLLGVSLFRGLSLSGETFPVGLRSFLPDKVTVLLEDVLEGVSGGAVSMLTSFSLLTALWSASKSVFYLIGGLNSVYEVKEERGFFKVRLLSMVYTMALLLAVAGALVLMVFGGFLANRAADCFPGITHLMRAVSAFRYLIGLLFLTAIFAGVYAFLPSRKASLKAQLPGALTAAAGWMLFSLLFSLYVDRFADYTHLYGGLAAIVIFMLWLYVCTYILLMGGEINLLIGRIARM